MDTTTKSLAGINTILGFWLIIAPFVFEAPTSDLWNDIIVGAAIVFLAGYNYYRETDQQPMSTGSAGLNLLLGFWLIVAPFITGVSGRLLWNDVIVGILVASFAGYNTYRATCVKRHTTTQQSEQTIE